MSTRRRFLRSAVVGSVLVGSTSRLLAQVDERNEHVAWVANALRRMQTVTPGMTRENLRAVFTTERAFHWSRTYLRLSQMPLFQGGCRVHAGRPASTRLRRQSDAR